MFHELPRRREDLPPDSGTPEATGTQAAPPAPSTDHDARLILRALPTALIVVDPDFRIRTVNGAVLDLLGYSESELIGKPMASIMGSPRQAVAGLTSMADLLFDETARAIEITYYARDGQPVPVTFSSSILRNGNGTSAILCAAQPIPDTQTAAGGREAADEVRARILGNLNHEIRTPLNAVLGMAELLLGTDLSEDQRDYIETILRSGRAILASVRDLLDFGETESRLAGPQAADFDVETCVEEALAHVLPAARARNLAVSHRVEPDVPRRVRGEAIRVRQILTHLLANAVRFTERGSIEVRVEREVASDLLEPADPGLRLRFRVRDTGPGIPPEKLRIIFEPFRQADESLTRRHGGLGLGLAISRRLVELMGGRIWVQSRPGEGSTFFFTVPVAPSQPRLNDLALVKGLDDTDHGSAGGRERPRRTLSILLAEDNPAHQRMTARFLERCGHAVKPTANGIGALEGWESGGFDLLILDSDMPGIDGPTAAKTIRRAEEGTDRHVPIIAFVAANDPDDRARCLAAGMDLALGKPVEAAELRRAVGRLTVSAD